MSDILQIDAIRRDGGTQSREALRPETISEYADRMREGDVFPDIVVFYDGDQYWLADGFHRIEAAKQAGSDVINADVRQGDQRAAILWSVKANATHGLPRTNADKRRAVLALLHDPEWSQWSDREIARQCGVTAPFVGTIRKEVTVNNLQSQTQRIVQRNGKTVIYNTENIGKQAAAPAPEENTDPQIDEEDAENFLDRGYPLPNHYAPSQEPAQAAPVTNKMLALAGVKPDFFYPVSLRDKMIYLDVMTYDNWRDQAMEIAHTYPGAAVEQGATLLSVERFRDFIVVMAKKRVKPPATPAPAPDPEPAQESWEDDYSLQDRTECNALLSSLEQLITMAEVQPDLIRFCLLQNDYSADLLSIVDRLLDSVRV